MTEKKFRNLLRKIDDAESIDVLSDIAKMMKKLVVDDENITIENKMLFLFLYLQHKEECEKMISEKIKIEHKKPHLLRKLLKYLITH